ncbi:hypothetical protein ACFL6C_00990 [Myxococcota bacterium]
MGRKRTRSDPRERRSPTDTVANLTDGFFNDLNIPALPDHVPLRLEEAIKARVDALLFHVREAKQKQYVAALEIRIIREAHRAVLAADELKIPDAKVHYATFRRLLEELGYERTEVGFMKKRDSSDT